MIGTDGSRSRMPPHQMVGAGGGRDPVGIMTAVRLPRHVAPDAASFLQHRGNHDGNAEVDLFQPESQTRERARALLPQLRRGRERGHAEEILRRRGACDQATRAQHVLHALRRSTHREQDIADSRSPDRSGCVIDVGCRGLAWPDQAPRRSPMIRNRPPFTSPLLLPDHAETAMTPSAR